MVLDEKSSSRDLEEPLNLVLEPKKKSWIYKSKWHSVTIYGNHGNSKTFGTNELTGTSLTTKMEKTFLNDMYRANDKLVSTKNVVSYWQLINIYVHPNISCMIFHVCTSKTYIMENV